MSITAVRPALRPLIALLTNARRLSVLVSLLVSAAFSSSLLAAPEPRWFNIELIVFSQTVNPSYAEHWPQQPELEFPANLLRFPSESRNNSEAELFIEKPFNGTLEKVKSKLERARGQRVLFARRWNQGLLDKQNAPYVYIRGGEPSGSHKQLEGSFQVSVERYLHVKANLWLSKFNDEQALPEQAFSLRRPVDDARANDFEGFGNEPEIIRLPPLPFPTNSDYQPHGPIETVFLLKQERRLRSSETHYIDHPALGIILRVEPLPNEQPGSQ